MAAEHEIDRIVVRLLSDVSNYIKGMEETTRVTATTGETIKEHTQSVKDFSDEVNNMGANLASSQAAMAALSSPLEFIKDSVKLAAAAESMEISFGTMLKSTEKGKEMVKDLQEFAAKTPLAMPELQSATKTLLQFGIEGREVLGLLKMLGDVSSGDSVKLQSMALAFGQMSATGRLMGQDLQQMISAGFNPLQEMARTTGKSMGVLRDEMEKGQITVDMVKNSFRTASSEGGNFFNGMEKASQGLEGLLSTMHDDIDSLKRTMGAAVIEGFHLKDMVKLVSDMCQLAVDAFNSLGDSVKNLITGMITLTGVMLVLTRTWRIGAAVWAITTGVWKDIGEQSMKLINAIRGLAATTVAANVAMGTSATVVQGTFVAGLGVAANSVGKFIKTIAVSPWTLWTAGIIGSVIALKELWQELDSGRESVQEMNKAIEAGKAISTRGRVEAHETLLNEIAKAEALTDADERMKMLERLNTRYQKNIGDIQRNIDGEKNIIARMKFDAIQDEKPSLYYPVIDREKDIMADLEKHLANYKDMAKKTQEAVDRNRKKADSPEAVKAVNDYNKALQEKIMTMGLDSNAADIQKLKLQGVTEAMLEVTKARQHWFEVEKNLQDAKDWQEQLEEDIKYFNMSKEEIKLYKLEMKAAELGIADLAKAGIDRLKGLMDQQKAQEDMNDLMKEAQKVMEDNKTPEEKYIDSMRRLDEMVEKGALGIEEYAKAAQKLQEDLDKTKQSTDALYGSIETLRTGTARSKNVLRDYFANLPEAMKAAQNIKPGANFFPNMAPAVESYFDGVQPFPGKKGLADIDRGLGKGGLVGAMGRKGVEDLDKTLREGPITKLLTGILEETQKANKRNESQPVASQTVVVIEDVDL